MGRQTPGSSYIGQWLSREQGRRWKQLTRRAEKMRMGALEKRTMRRLGLAERARLEAEALSREMATIPTESGTSFWGLLHPELRYEVGFQRCAELSEGIEHL